jgi:DNA repair protein RadC
MRNIVNRAIEILESQARYHEMVANNPDDVKNYLRLKLAHLEHEVFAVMFLDNRHQLIEYEELFRGTIDGALVYPREIVKRALQLNAAALIIAHNHPSGVTEPSQADESITHRIKDACALMDIRLLDHIIVGLTDSVSLAEQGVI